MSHHELLAFDEVSHRLGLLGQAYAGVRPIPVERIVGSVDRSREFDRRFRPRGGRLSALIRRVGRAFPDGAFPPIDVYEIGGVYFVSDGHKRVAAARRRGAAAIDAAVIHVETGYALPPDVDVRQLIHTEQHRLFMEHSGLGRARPDADIRFSRPHGYPELLEAMKAHGYGLERQRDRLLEDWEVAADFYDHVYVPGAAAVEAHRLREKYWYKTDTDLFLWLYQVRRTLAATDPDADFHRAARFAHAQRIDHRFRRQFLRERSEPLPRRAARRA